MTEYTLFLSANGIITKIDYVVVPDTHLFV